MSDPQNPTTISQIVALLVALVGGGGVVKGWERWRRNGQAGRDARHIIAAIQNEAQETRTVLRDLTTAISDLRTEVARKGPG